MSSEITRQTRRSLGTSFLFCKAKTEFTSLLTLECVRDWKRVRGDEESIVAQNERDRKICRQFQVEVQNCDTQQNDNGTLVELSVGRVLVKVGQSSAEDTLNCRL